MARFPTLASLAEADLDAVLHEWQGLGYYRRARALHACARAAVAEHGGRLPHDLHTLRKLPGLGAYTAAAVAAIAFDQPIVPVDGNVERVLGRVLALDAAPAETRRVLTDTAAMLASPGRPADLAQAVMELGALVCRPRAPACLMCPWRPSCRAAASGTPEAFPRAKARAVRPVLFATAFLLRRDGAILFRRRPETGLLAGLLELPTTPWLDQPLTPAEEATAAPSALPWRRLPGTVTYGFTHRELRFTLVTAEADAELSGIWTRPDELARLALPTLTLRLLRHGGVPVGRSRAPHVLEMEGPAPRRDGNDVETLAEVAQMRSLLQENAGSTGDAHLLAGLKGRKRRVSHKPPLDLDEDQEVVTAGDEVDLADGNREPAGDDGVALELQEEGHQRLRTPAGPLARPTAHRPRKASAR
jgi:A/G-specific adenine glycosylase